MDALLISLFVRGAIRLGNAGKLAYEQQARDKPVLLPDAWVNQISQDAAVANEVNAKFGNAPIPPDSPYRPYWDTGNNRINTNVPGAAASLRALLVRDKVISAAAAPGQRLADKEAAKETTVAITLVAQWRDGKGPPHPWVHIALALVDVGLDFLSTKPELAGLSGTSGKLIASMADSLGDLIPKDTTEFDPKAVFGQRLITAFLRSGLKAVSDNAGAIVGEEHFQILISESLKPAIAAIDGTTTLSWADVAETLIGPVAEAAVGVLAKHPEKYLGRKLSTEKAVGALVQGALKTTADQGLRTTASQAGMVALFKSAAAVAAERPELFLHKKQNPGDEDKFKADLFVKVMKVLNEKGPPFSAEVGIGIASAAIESLKSHAPDLLGVDDDWDEVVGAATGMVLDGFRDGFARRDGKTLENIFARAKLVELGRVFLVQAAANPGMIVGGTKAADKNKELKAIVTTVAKAMTADEKLLLTADDWIVIAQVAIETAAAYPGRLFGFDEADPQNAAVAGVIATLLMTAADGVGNVRELRQKGRVLGGTILREALEIALEELAGKVTVIIEKDPDRKKLAALMGWLVTYAKDNKIGSADWPKLYRGLLRRFLADGPFEKPTAEILKAILGGE